MTALVTTPTLGARGGTIGRPRKQPPVDAAKRIEELAAQGRGIVAVALLLGTSRETLQRWMTEDPTLQEAFARGKEAERHDLHQMMIRDARDGEKPNVNAMFLLTTRHGYREGDPGEQPNRVNVTINLPAARPLSDFIEVSDDADGSNQPITLSTSRA